jgi:hypothetical protein
MVNNKKTFMATLMATTLLTAGAAWSASQQTPAQQTSTAQQTSADRDFAKLSADGSRAFEDLTLTRLAIYDGRIADAKKYVNDAGTSFAKARTDETVFTKAQADLKPPAGNDASANKNVSAAAPVDKVDGEKIPGAPNGMVSEMADQKKPIAWLPVDGTITINEDYTTNPVKTAAVADANKSLQSGDRKTAMEKLKLADMNVDVTLAIIPLEQTIKYAHQAAGLIDENKYYEASQLLRQAQDNLRFDVANIPGAPTSK